MNIAILFIFGLLIGSFLNVVTMRYDLGGSILFTRRIGGRSHCPQCKTTLKWYELLPLISFVIQGGKCRHCSYRLSWQYPLVELIAGILTAAVPTVLMARFDPLVAASLGHPVIWFYVYTGLWLLAAYAFLVLAIIDLRHTIIPDAANILLAIIGLALIALKSFQPDMFAYHGSFVGGYALIFQITNVAWLDSLIAAGFGAALFGGIIALSRGKGMGLGDLKLVIPIGLLLGWPDTVLALAFSFIIGAVVSVGLMALRRKSFRSAVPFGPFLALAVFVMMFYGEAILRWYFTLL